MKWCLAVIVLVAVAHEIENTPQPCSSYDNCPSCVTFSNDRVSPCGWCAAENRCVDGTLHGPAVGNCTIWDYGFCSGEPCSNYLNPIACHQDVFCIWCRDSGSCMEGTPEQGPLFGECKSGDFFVDLHDLREKFPEPLTQRPPVIGEATLPPQPCVLPATC